MAPLKRRIPRNPGHQEPLLGIEEEIFVTHPERTSLESLYYLAKLLWKNPRYYYSHSDSNFARGNDVKQGIMGGVELSTGCHSDVATLVDDLAARRAEFSATCSDALLVPVGHLIDLSAPTLTCGMHIHIGNLPDSKRAYAALVHYLPLLALIAANAPFVAGQYFGQSYRMAHSYAIGALRSDPWYRFQDIIFARRLGTIEIRVFDPVWDLGRLRMLVDCILAIVKDGHEYALDRETYNCLRPKFVVEGYSGELRPLYEELRGIIDVPEELFKTTPSDKVKAVYEERGLLPTYSALDNAYRNNVFEARDVPAMKKQPARAAVGLASYYIVRLPYKLQKVLKEW
ncbi:MAG: hypothetical protein HPY55_14545 [Firmicutes bacterium]|nr:hypothetical protein [Bacillota bacterium]